MRCFYCGSENVKTVHTDGKRETLKVNLITEGTAFGTKQEVVDLPVTRRVIKCNNCYNLFNTVEVFEKSSPTSPKAIANVDVLIVKSNQDKLGGIGSQLSEDQKEGILKEVRNL